MPAAKVLRAGAKAHNFGPSQGLGKPGGHQLRDCKDGCFLASSRRDIINYLLCATLWSRQWFGSGLSRGTLREGGQNLCVLNDDIVLMQPAAAGVRAGAARGVRRRAQAIKMGRFDQLRFKEALCGFGRF